MWWPMSLWRSLRSGARTLFRRDIVERELDDELRFYFEMQARENVRRGMTPEDAERAARIHLGGLESARIEVRSAGWEARVESLRQDLRVAWRGLKRGPSFALVAISSLALGIGAVTTMFSVLNAVMFRPLPYRDANRLTLIWTDDTRRGLHREATAYLTVTDWQQHSRAYGDLAYYSTQRVAPMSNDPGQGRGRARSALVSPNLFTVLGVSPIRGRLISAADDRDRAPVAVISHAFWQRWFGGAEDVIGKSLLMDDASKGGLGAVTVIGVLPPGFFFPDKLTDMYTPASTYWRFDREALERFQPWARRWTAVGRLAPGASIEDARAELDRLGRQLAQTHPSDVSDFPGFATTVLPVLDSIAGTSLQSALWVLFGAVSLVLLVVCANVANLQLARGATRTREFAVRRALGASRGRIASQLVSESMLLVLVGGIVGTVVAAWATPLLGQFAASYVPRMDEIRLDSRVLAFAAMASIVSGVVFGVIPASRLSSTDAADALREGAHGTGSARLRRSQGALVLAECALALVLLTGAGLLLESLRRVQSVDPGFNPRGVLAMRLEFPSEAPPTAEERTQTSQIAPARARVREQTMSELLDRVAAIPGVATAGFTDDLFIGGQGHASIAVPGKTADQLGAGELNDARVTPAFFSVMRVPLRRGRYLTRDDAAQKIRALWQPIVTDMLLADKERLATPEPVVVNEAFVRRFFADEDPIGKKFCVDPTNKTYWYEIVGVVGDMHRSGLERASIPEYYGPYFPSPGGRADLVVRAERDPLLLVATIRREVTRALPNVVIVSASTAESQLGDFGAQRRFQTWLLTGFALLALTLAAVGIFGLAHYAVAERTKEIGVRVALGATPGDVVRLVIAQGMRMPGLGIVLGLAASAGLTRVISHQLYGVGATDPVTFAVVALLLATVAASACYLAARRAAAADPVQALRQG